MTYSDEPGNGADPRGLRSGTVWLLVLALLSLLTIAATWVLFPSRYWSEALIECVSDRPAVPEVLFQPTMPEAERERFINSQAAVIKSQQVLFEALKTAEVRSTRWFAQWNDRPDERPIALEAALVSFPMPDTNFIRVAMACRERADPAIIVDQVVKVYLALVYRQARDAFRKELAGYKDEADDLDRQIRAKIQQIREFTATLPPGSTALGGGMAYETLVLYSEQVAALEIETMELDGLRQMYQDPTGPAISPDDQRQIEQDPQIVRLENEALSLELDLLTLGADEPENETARTELTTRHQAVRQKLGELRTQKVTEVQAWRAGQLRDAFLRAQHALLLTRNKLADVKAAQADLDRKAAERQMLKDELDYLKESRARANEYIRKLRRIAGERGRAVQVSWGLHPSEPTDPDRSLHYRVTAASLAVPMLFGACLGLKRAVLRRQAPQPAGTQT